MKIGYKACRGCGEETNCVELVSGYCPACAKVHADNLSAYQRQYEEALAGGDKSAVARVGELISAYEKSERLRLRDVAKSCVECGA